MMGGSWCKRFQIDLIIQIFFFFLIRVIKFFYSKLRGVEFKKASKKENKAILKNQNNNYWRKKSETFFKIWHALRLEPL